MKKTVLLFAAMLLVLSVAASKKGEEEEKENGRVSKKKGFFDKAKEAWNVMKTLGKNLKESGKKAYAGFKKIFKGDDDDKDEHKKPEMKKAMPGK